MQGFGCLWIAGAPLMLPGTLLRLGALQLKIAFSKANAVYECVCDCREMATWGLQSKNFIKMVASIYSISFCKRWLPLESNSLENRFSTCQNEGEEVAVNLSLYW